MFGDKKVIAIIPARGGSKRIPKKNIADFHGKPMIAWTIEAAKNSEYIDRVVVLTDCHEIAQVAKEYGADIPFLRTDDADDFTPISEVTANAMAKINPTIGRFDIVVQLMANCPLRGAKDIKGALEAFKENDAKSLISFFSYGYQNPWWAHERNADGTVNQIFQQTTSMRSQDLPRLFCPTGAIWIANVDELLSNRTFYIKGYYSYILNWKSGLDIDDYDDLELAKATFSFKQ